MFVTDRSAPPVIMSSTDSKLREDLSKLRRVAGSLESADLKAEVEALMKKWEKSEQSMAVDGVSGVNAEGSEESLMSLHGNEKLTWGFQKWVDGRVLPGNPCDALILGVHCLMLEHRFINMTRVPSTVPGFAPSVREVNPSKFIPEDWRSTVATEGLLYKHPSARAPFQIVIKTIGEDSASINLSQKSKVLLDKIIKISSVIAVKNFNTNAGKSLSPYELFSDLEQFKDDIFLPILATVPQDPSAVSASMMAIEPDRKMESLPAYQEPELQRPERGFAAPNRSPPVSVGGVGSSDLNPAGVPDFDHRPYPFSVGPEAGGSLVGPGHPLFGSDPSGLRYRDPGYPAFPRAPQPRFDPYGPVPGANGPDFGGGMPGRPFPGEPEPDHLKPPGVPDPLKPPQPDRFNFLRDPKDPRRPGAGAGGMGGGRIFER